MSATPPPPIEKDSVHSASSSRHRPPLPPKERRRSKGSTLQLVPAHPDKLVNSASGSKRRPQRRHQLAIINQLASIKQWFMESAKRAKSPGTRSDSSALKTPNEKSLAETKRSPKNAGPTATVPINSQQHTLRTPQSRIANPAHRLSMSPVPLTPRSSYRRSSAGLRGRKSTSSSVSSIRSIHHVHSHSKASSTSSNSNSVNSSAIQLKSTRSPHTSVKVLPATPTTSAFPSNVRVARNAPTPISTHYNESASFGAMPSPGLVFAKRKKTPFRGPMLHINPTRSPAGRGRDTSVGSRSASAAGRRSGEIVQIQEEDEDEIEEVEAFSPVASAEVEETVWEGDRDQRGT